MRQGDTGTYVCPGGFKWLGEGCPTSQSVRAQNGSQKAVTLPPLEPLLAEGILLGMMLNSLMGVERLGQTYTLALTLSTLILNWRPNKIHLQIYGKQH